MFALQNQSKKQQQILATILGLKLRTLTLKKTDLAKKINAKNIAKKYRKMVRKTPYAVPQISLTETTNPEDIDRSKTMEILDDIATLEPGKNAQIAAKKISERYKKIRETKKRKTFKLPGEIAQIQVEEIPQVRVEIPASIPQPISNISKLKTAKKVSKNYEEIKRQKSQKLAKIKVKEVIEERKPSSKSARIAAKKISDKYKKIRNKRNIDVAEEIRDVASKKSTQPAAKKYQRNIKKRDIKNCLQVLL